MSDTSPASTGPGYSATAINSQGNAEAPAASSGPFQGFLETVASLASDLSGGRVVWEFDEAGPYPRPTFVWEYSGAFTPGQVTVVGSVQVPLALAPFVGRPAASPPVLLSIQSTDGVTARAVGTIASPGYWCPNTKYASVTAGQRRAGTVRAAALGNEIAVLTWRTNDRLTFDLPDVSAARVWQFNRDDVSFASVTGEGTGTRHNLFQRMLEHAAGESLTDPDIYVYPWDRIASTTGIYRCRWDDSLADSDRFVRASSAMPSERDISFSLRVVEEGVTL